MEELPARVPELLLTGFHRSPPDRGIVRAVNVESFLDGVELLSVCRRDGSGHIGGEIAVRVQRGAERLENGTLRLGIDIDERVPANDEVEHPRRPLANEIPSLETDHVGDGIFYPEGVVIAIDEALPAADGVKLFGHVVCLGDTILVDSGGAQNFAFDARVDDFDAVLVDSVIVMGEHRQQVDLVAV